MRPLASFKTPLLSVIASSPGVEQATMTAAVEELEGAGAAADETATDDAFDEEAEEVDTGAGAAELGATEAELVGLVDGAEAEFVGFVDGVEAGVAGLMVGAWAWPSMICVTGATVVAAWICPSPICAIGATIMVWMLPWIWPIRKVSTQFLQTNCIMLISPSVIMETFP